ncbi:MAG: hypothetical protein J6O55_09110 [Lachnospiraceae bacterium]|nr:hypothetical protein [Lachnospiraceae bacterium]
MEKNTLAVFDCDREYVMRLMDFLCGSNVLPLEIQAFTDKNKLKDFIRKNRVDIVLISEEALDEEIESIVTGETMVLTENDLAEDNRGHKAICKYQSSENIMREVMCYYAEKPVATINMSLNSKTEFIAVYSPIRRCFRTSFALALGEILAEKKKVLYVNLEEYSGFHQLLQRNFMLDISDLIFYIGQKKHNFPCKLGGMVQSLGGMDFIPPVVSPEDLKSVDKGKWINFFSELATCDYEIVILDLGESISAFLDILSECRTIYTPIREDSVSQAKLEQYEAMLHILECAGVLERTKKLHIPFFREINGNLAELKNSPLGDYVRGLLRWEGLT